MSEAYATKGFLCPEPDMLPGRIKMSFKKEKSDQYIFEQAMIRSGQDEFSAGPQEPRELLKDKINVIDVLNDL